MINHNVFQYNENFMKLFGPFSQVFITFEPNSWFLYEPESGLLIFELDIFKYSASVIKRFGKL
jgi:hypothetical protein